MMSLATLLVALVIIIAGLIGTYFGYKFFKIYLAFVGFVTGFMLGINFFGEVTVVSLVVGFVLALIFSCLSFVFFKFALFMSFAFVGANFGFWILSTVFGMPDGANTKIIGVVIGVILGVILIIMNVDKPAIAIVTSLVGAYFLVVGIASLLDNSLIQPVIGLQLLSNDLLKLNLIALKAFNLVMSNIIFTVIYVFFALTGIIYQLKNKSED